MSWCWAGDEPLTETMIIQLTYARAYRCHLTSMSWRPLWFIMVTLLMKKLWNVFQGILLTNIILLISRGPFSQSHSWKTLHSSPVRASYGSVFCEFIVRTKFWLSSFHIVFDIMLYSSVIYQEFWCYQASSHYLFQCGPRSLMPYGIIKTYWNNINFVVAYNNIKLYWRYWIQLIKINQRGMSPWWPLLEPLSWW